MPDTTQSPQHPKQHVICPSCHAHYILIQQKSDQSPQYCPFCKAILLSKNSDASEAIHTLTGASTPGTLIQEHIPEEKQIRFSIGPYQILDSIGKGGMGEVFLAYDTLCGRKIALKRIRPDLVSYKQLHNRFLREARLTSQLTHPAIIPIYTIQNENDLVYYTMPFVQGDTLKKILKTARQQSQQGLKSDHLGGSIPALVRIFLSVCQAVAYAHAKGVLHRDLKPDNVIVGPYGEVLILDWGLAKLSTVHAVDEKLTETVYPPEEIYAHPQLTRIGKVVGTIAYMAPEIALGEPATYQTDIYSLGVVLYQILTLRHPYHRRNLQEFRQNVSKEVLYHPSEVAPYRDVPPILARITLKCLTPSPEERYKTVDELIHDIENYIEGRSEWFKISELNIHDKAHWEFQENVLIAEHMAITRVTEVSDWVSLMISKDSFTENTKIEARVKIGNKGHGIGFLLSVPEAAERVHLNNGYCLWLASDLTKSTKLLRATVEVLQAPDIFLQRNEWAQVRIEKIDNNIYFYLNDALQFSYISHLPLTGTHLGLLSRDADFSIQDFVVYIGSQNIKVNCLAVPDAFLAHKNYAVALSEYRRIGYSFPGTAEGREAMFRAGVTLLESARSIANDDERMQKYEETLEEFGKLHKTPGAPLEYLGKALVYQALEDYEEEVKCFELAHRRYPHHPLLPVLQEQLVYRIHDSSRYHRKATYALALIAVRYLPFSKEDSNIRKLFNSLKRHWEPLSFIEDAALTVELQDYNFAIALAFWLSKPYVLEEIIDHITNMEPPKYSIFCNALFCLLELGAWKIVQKKLDLLYQKIAQVQDKETQSQKSLDLIKAAMLIHTHSWKEALDTILSISPKHWSLQETRSFLYILEHSRSQQQLPVVDEIISRLSDIELTLESRLQIDCALVWTLLLEKNWIAAGKMLQRYPLEQLAQETSLLHFLYGCWLYATEGKEIATIHFASILEVAYPRSWTLFSHFIHNKMDEKQLWLKKAFLWEKRKLYQQFALFYHCAGNAEKVSSYQNLEKQEYLNPDE